MKTCRIFPTRFRVRFRTMRTADTYARPISRRRLSVDIQNCVKSGDVYTVTAALIRDENEAEPQAIFTAELVPNPREMQYRIFI